MVCSHPYNTWPLHVKLFTDEAVKAWSEPAKNSTFLPLPPGLTVLTELEGVDGKSGKAGTGRVGPINVTDGQGYRLFLRSSSLAYLIGPETFTSEHLEKTSNLIIKSPSLRCHICCQSIIDNFSKV